MGVLYEEFEKDCDFNDIIIILAGPMLWEMYGQINSEESAKALSEMNLEDLLNLEVTTASKKAEKTTDAPGIISMVTSEEIKNLEQII